MKSLKIFFLLCLILSFITGCMKANVLPRTPSIEIPSSGTSPILPTGTSSLANISTLIISSTTPSSTRTHTSSFISTPIYKPTPSITLTAIPTLPVESARIRLLDLLANNGNCRLPCLWGITPGGSKYQDARIILEPLSSISNFTDFHSGPGAINPIYTTDDLLIYTTIRFITYPSTDIVSQINFEARALKEMIGERGVVGVFDSSVFGKRLSLYMLPQILSQYGNPSSVLVTTLAEPPPQSRGGDIGYFRIILLYPDKGIFVRYITQIHPLNGFVLGCPNDAHIELELYPTGNSDTFFTNLDPSIQADIRNNYKPINEVTDMSISDFYQTFHEPTDTCIKTPSNLWPLPEQ